MLSDFKTIKVLWMSDEGCYKVGSVLQTKVGSLTVVAIQRSEEGADILVRRDRDGWHGAYATVQQAHIVGFQYDIPKIEEADND